MKTKTALTCASLIACALSHVSACTWFEFQNDLKHTFIGRSMEWPGDLQGEMTIVPRNHGMGEAKKFKTRHGFVGISHAGMFSDGLNEHGLACSALWLAESKYQDKTPEGLHVGDVVGYVLGNMKTVDEAVTFFKETPLYSEKVAIMNDILPTFHFAVTDPNGRSVVVEVIDGKTQIHENKVGVMTNDPPYDEQLKIWSKYEVRQLNEESFEAFDYSPEGRFCRMAAINATQAKVPTDAAAVNRAWSMLNTVDIPKGILYWRWVNDDPQFTSYAVVGDLNNRVYYFRTYDNYDIRKVDLAKIDFSKVPFRSASIFGGADYKEFQFAGH
jgi:choloylglycine hydrolase